MPWYYKDSREREYGPCDLKMSKVEKAKEKDTPSLTKLYTDRQIGLHTLVRSELTGNMWAQLQEQLPSDGAVGSRGPM